MCLLNLHGLTHRPTIGLPSGFQAQVRVYPEPPCRCGQSGPAWRLVGGCAGGRRSEGQHVWRLEDLWQCPVWDITHASSFGSALRCVLPPKSVPPCTRGGCVAGGEEICGLVQTTLNLANPPDCVRAADYLVCNVQAAAARAWGAMRRPPGIGGLVGFSARALVTM